MHIHYDRDGTVHLRRDDGAAQTLPAGTAAADIDAAAAAFAPPVVAPVPDTITRRQCAREMFARGMITGPELVAMTATGTPPAMVEAILAALPEVEQWPVRADFAAATYDRGNPLLVSLMTASGARAADIDDFFRAAAGR